MPDYANLSIELQRGYGMPWRVGEFVVGTIYVYGRDGLLGPSDITNGLEFSGSVYKREVGSGAGKWGSWKRGAQSWEETGLSIAFREVEAGEYVFAFAPTKERTYRLDIQVTGDVYARSELTVDVEQPVTSTPSIPSVSEFPYFKVPTLSNATASATGSTTAEGSVTTDKATGTLFWIVTTSTTEPTPGQIKDGKRANGDAADDSGSQSISSTGTKTVSASGLLVGSVYQFYFVHENSAGDSNIASASFSTGTATLSASLSITNNDPSVSATGSASGGSEPYTYEWDWGDGTTSTGKDASHTYQTDGTYTVTLTVTDDNGDTATASADVPIIGADVGAVTDLSAVAGTGQNDITWTSPDETDLGSDTLYRDTTTPVDPSNATTVTTVDSPSAQQSNSFTDTSVTGGQTYYYLVVTEDTSGNTAQSNEDSATPSSDTTATADFTFDASSDPTVDFDASASDGTKPLAYDWTFGDGASDTGELTSHTYGSTGDFDVTLTVTDDNGNTDTTTKTITISNEMAPIAPGNFVPA